MYAFAALTNVSTFVFAAADPLAELPSLEPVQLAASNAETTCYRYLIKDKLGNDKNHSLKFQILKIK
tara:strand:+ start:142 stop:342 length:201 start_codon:yes stop_codon:yes gene_type:complete